MTRIVTITVTLALTLALILALTHTKPNLVALEPQLGLSPLHHARSPGAGEVQQQQALGEV